MAIHFKYNFCRYSNCTSDSLPVAPQNHGLLPADTSKTMSITSLGLTGSSNAIYINNSTGFVGIGKSNASYALDVVGDVNFSGQLLSSNTAIGGVGTGIASQFISNTTVSSPYPLTVTFSSGGASGATTMVVTSAAITTTTNPTYFFIYVKEATLASGAQNGTGLARPIICTTGILTAATSFTLTLSVALTATASGTYTLVPATAWTVPSSVYGVNVEMVGGGGGGGGGLSSSNPTAGSGGGAGCYVKGKISVTPGTTYYYTVGKGGVGQANNTSNDSLADYGHPTLFSNSTSTVYLITYGGSGGQCCQANYTAKGGFGSSTYYQASFNEVISVIGGDGFSTPSTYNQTQPVTTGGNGGASFYGGGGLAGYDGTTPNDNKQFGSPGRAYGSGGGGGRYASSGGDGAKGVLILSYFSNVMLSNSYTPVEPLYFDGTNLKMRPFAFISQYLSTAPATGSYVTAGTFVSGTTYTPTYCTTFGSSGVGLNGYTFTQGAKGLKAPISGYYHFALNFLWGGTSGNVLVGYYDGTTFFTRIVCGDTVRFCANQVFYVPQNAEIYIYLNTGNLTNTTGTPALGGSTVTSIVPSSTFSISLLSPA